MLLASFTWVIGPVMTVINWVRSWMESRRKKPLFVTPRQYQQQIETELFEGCGLLDRTHETVFLNDFVSGTDTDVMLVHAAAGFGKSHFLVSAAKTLTTKKPRRWQIRFCRASVRSVESAIQDEIDPKKQYVIILDNANLDEDTTKLLLRVVSARPARAFKLVLSCRTPAAEVVRSWVREARHVGAELVLPDLSVESLTQLLRKASNQRFTERPEPIIEHFGKNPSLVISYGRLIRGATRPADVKVSVSQKVMDSAIPLEQEHFIRTEIAKLLAELAVLVPFHLSDTAVIDRLGQLFNRPKEGIAEAIRSLVRGRTLRSVGSTVRFREDFSGDIYLSQYLDQPDGATLASDMLTRWTDLKGQDALRNLASAARHSDTSAIRDTATHFVETFVNQIDAKSVHERRAFLKIVTPLVTVTPRPIIDLLSALSALQHSPDEISGDDYGQILVQIIRVPGFQRDVLEFARMLETKAIRSSYANYRADDMARKAVSPIGAKMEIAMESLSLLEEWASDLDCDAVTVSMVLSGAKEALAGSHAYDESYQDKIVWGKKSLVYSAKVGEYRSIAMNALRLLLQHHSEAVRLQAIDAAEHIGHEAPSSEGPLWNRIVMDRREVIHWFSQILDRPDLTFATQSRIEDVLVTLWAANERHEDASQQAEELLKGKERSPEYLIFRLFAGGDFFVEDIDQMIAAAPPTNRWRWLVDNHFRRYSIEAAELDPIVQKLSIKFASKERLVSYLRSLDAMVTGTHYRLPLVECWAHVDPATVQEVLKDPQAVGVIPDRFQCDFALVGARTDKGFVDRYASGLMAQTKVSAVEVNRLLYLMAESGTGAPVFMTWFRNIIPKLDKFSLHVMWQQIYYPVSKLPMHEQKCLLELIELLLDMAFDQEFCMDAEFLITHLISDKIIPLTDFAPARSRFLLLLRDLPDLKYHEQRLLQFAVGGDLNALLDFIEYRLSKADVSSDRFDAIPFGGLEQATVVRLQTDCGKLVDRVISWHERKLLATFELADLLKGLPNSLGGTAHVIDEYLTSGTKRDIGKAIICLYGVVLSTLTAATFVNTFERAEAVGLGDEADDVLQYQIFTGGGSSSMGVAPPYLVAKKEALQAMRDKMHPGRARSRLDQYIESITLDINRHLDSDAEFMDPKL